MAQTLKILTDAYTSHIVRGQSTLKDVIERYFWNGLSRERMKAMKALYALYANVLVEKRTLVAHSLCNLLNTTTTVRLKNKTLMDANCSRRKTPCWIHLMSRNVATITVRMMLISRSEW